MISGRFAYTVYEVVAIFDFDVTTQFSIVTFLMPIDASTHTIMEVGTTLIFQVIKITR